LTLAEAPVNRIAPVFIGSMRFTRLLRHQEAAEGAYRDRVGDVCGRPVR